MDAKYNFVMDSVMLRVAMVAVGFGLWLGAGLAVLAVS